LAAGAAESPRGDSTAPNRPARGANFPNTGGEHAKFKAAVHPMIDERIKYLNKLGLDGKFIMDTIMKLADKYNADNPVAPYLTDLIDKK